MSLTTVLIYRVVEVYASLSIIEYNVAVYLNSASIFFNFATYYSKAYYRLGDAVNSY